MSKEHIATYTQEGTLYTPDSSIRTQYTEHKRKGKPRPMSFVPVTGLARKAGNHVRPQDVPEITMVLLKEGFTVRKVPHSTTGKNLGFYFLVPKEEIDKALDVLGRHPDLERFKKTPVALPDMLSNN